MASDRRQRPHRGRALRIPLLSLAAAALTITAFAAPASAEVVYDNAPPAAAAEVPSLGFEETGTAELGSLVRLVGAARFDPQVRVETVVGGCEAEPLEGGCTTPGATFPLPATLSVYAGPPAAGANPREAEGVYRAATAAATTAPFAFEAQPGTWQGRQPAFTVEAAAPAAAPAAPATTPPPAARPARREFTIPPSKRMTVDFPRATAPIAGPGALVQVKCSGSSAARCIGTLSLSAAGTVHKAPFSISKGRRQYVVVPLGSDLELLDGLDAPRATATANTVQVGGAAVRTKRALKLK